MAAYMAMMQSPKESAVMDYAAERQAAQKNERNN